MFWKIKYINRYNAPSWKLRQHKLTGALNWLGFWIVDISMHALSSADQLIISFFLLLIIRFININIQISNLVKKDGTRYLSVSLPTFN